MDCVASTTTVDMQPFAVFFHTAVAIVALTILFSRRPVDPSNAHIAGILLVVFAG